MKRVIAIIFSVVIFAALFGCQATPEKEVVIQKDMEDMIEKAQETPQASEALASTLKDRLRAPGTYKNSFSNAKGSVTVNVDADVVLPDSNTIPTAKVKENKFSQETADKLMELLLKGQTLYDYASYVKETKEDIQEKLLKLYAMREGTIPVDVDGDLEGTIALYEKELAEAPEVRTKTAAQTAFRQLAEEGAEPYDYIEGVAEVDGEPAYFLIKNNTAENNIYTEYYKNVNDRVYYNSINDFKGMFKLDETKLKMDITADEAQAQADAIIKGLGLSSSMTCASAEIGIHLDDNAALEEGKEINYATTKTAWIVRYVRMLDGVPITFTGDTGSNVENEESYAQPWPYEALNFIIDGTGIVEFHWSSPYTDPEIVTSDTNLMSFAEIQEIFEKMVLINYSFFESGSLQLDINSVELGLMRITESEERDSGVLIPVWNFMGSVTALREGEEPDLWQQTSNSLLTINAIDGTIINSGLGY